jgi:hypothetical protein
VEIAIFLIQCGGLLSTVNREGEDCMTVIITNPALSDHCLYVAQLLIAAGFELKVKHLNIARHCSQTMGEIIKAHYSTPTKLSWLSRLAIRKHLLELSGHTSIKPRVSSLPLPEWLRDFVMLVHI